MGTTSPAAPGNIARSDSSGGFGELGPAGLLMLVSMLLMLSASLPALEVWTGGAQEAVAGKSCYAALRNAGVSFKRIPAARAPGVELPLRLRGPLRGVEIHGGPARARTNILDCRLALALLAWSTTLRQARVVRVDHFSIYRQDDHIAGTRKISAHAHGLAIDAARFRLQGGADVSVLKDWGNRRRHADPCGIRPWERNEAKLLRRMTCGPALRGIFQVVLTPHYNDAHQNHVHLEFKPGDDDGPWIR